MVITQGEPGDAFFVIADGVVEIVVDGVRRRMQGAGEHFGELALLRDTARSATVLARTPVTLLTIDRAEFLAGTQPTLTPKSRAIPASPEA
ncbi:cyclic nucleotide-binding domain-containing protein [Pseudonocardia saturnea]